MDPLDDAAIDALIRAEDARLRQFKLFHASREARLREYGGQSPPPPPPTPPAPNRPALRGGPMETLTPDVEEALMREYTTRYRPNKMSQEEEISRRHSTPPPPGYCGPMLTLTTSGPYTRYEVLAVRPPPRPHYDESGQKRKSRSSHYPRPVPPVSQEEEKEKKPQPGESLRRWKYNMGLTDE
ncbi:uncharacterized protein TM35_000043400 [Trypanosoma theileri]|uniref:Uncharacterized protein n=1 Tax=Trypanosoma theileri TaxID=67003 RepID=A0A1X0P5A8_9TRYP|nr:uncharacterized protein TM35_000043400 [Trypanosoma theileri]ORC92126.1 hypothetical protein TM35_000043400 [Trypanosoma theileri]